MKARKLISSTAAGFASWAPDALMAAGAAAISYGAGLVYRPAGFVIAGMFLLAAGWLLARGGR